MKPISHSKAYAPDITIFLFAIPFINAFNYYFTYSNVQFNGFFLLTFTIDTVQGYMAWWIVRLIILRLDRFLPYHPKIWKRIFIQLVWTTLAGLGFIAITTELLSWLVKGERAPLSFYTLDLILISVWFLVINGVYIGIYFYRQWQIAVGKQRPEEEQSSGLLVKKGKESRLIRFGEIELLYVEEGYVHLVDVGGKQYLLDQSLSQLQEQMPRALFFRLNRQCIIHRRLINGFRRLENGKLRLQLNLALELPFDLTISRLKAPAFKRWFTPE